MSLPTVIWNHVHAGGDANGVAWVDTANGPGTQVKLFGGFATIADNTLNTSGDYTDAVSVPIVGLMFTDNPVNDSRYGLVGFQCPPADNGVAAIQAHVWCIAE